MLTITLHIYWVLPRHSWHTMSFIPHNRPVRLILLLCPVNRWETKAGGLKFSAQGHTASKWHSQDSNTTSNKCFWDGQSDTLLVGDHGHLMNIHVCQPVCVCVCKTEQWWREREKEREYSQRTWEKQQTSQGQGMVKRSRIRSQN